MWGAWRNMKIGVFVAGLIFASVVIFFITKARKKGYGPHLSLAMLGYTNDVAGVRYDCLSLTNLDATPVFVIASFVFTNKTGGSNAGYPVSPAVLPNILKLGEFQIIAFPTPANQMPWKLEVSYVQYPALRGGFWGIAEIFKSVMSGGRRVIMQHDIRTDWVDGKPGRTLWTNSDPLP
jgi:hypothetical protein